MKLSLENIVEFATNEFPEIVEKYRKEQKASFETFYNGGEILVYPFFGCVIQEHFLELIRDHLNKGDDSVSAELLKMTAFFEKLANSNDFDVENVLAVGILEGITGDANELELILNILGEKSKKFY